ncbi:hypothetical protein GBA52_015342 [Prunus armeniaca]|nr:hypothetical protein GBA52_015342 [Prunus armeniaca]
MPYFSNRRPTNPLFLNDRLELKDFMLVSGGKAIMNSRANQTSESIKQSRKGILLDQAIKLSHYLPALTPSLSQIIQELPSTPKVGR